MHRPIILLALPLVFVPTYAATAAILSVVSQPIRTFGLGDVGAVAVSPEGSHFATAGQGAAFLWDYGQGTVRHRFTAHQSRVTALAFSPDGAVSLTAGYDRLIRAWDVESGAELRSFAGHQSEITQLAFAPDGQSFVSAGDNTARVWSLSKGDLLHTVSVPGEFINAAIFAPDGVRLVTADSSPTNNVRLWELASETTLRTFGEHVGRVWGLSFAAGGRLATGGDDKTIRIWDIETGVRIRSLQGATLLVLSLAAHTNGPTVIAGCQDGRVIAWNSETGGVEADHPGEWLIALNVVPGTNQVLTAHSDHLLRVRDLASGDTVRTIHGHTTSVTLGVGFSPDGRYVVSGGGEAATRLWNRTNGQLVRTFTGHPAGTMAATFSPDGTKILTTRGIPHVAQLWNTETGQLEREFTGHNGWLLAAAFSADGQRVVTGAQDGTARLWDVTTGLHVRAFATQSAWIRSVAVNSNGTVVASGGSDGVARLWNASNGQLLHSFELNAGSVKTLSFSPVSAELLVGWEDGYLQLFDPVTGKFQRGITTPAAFLNHAVFSPNGEFVLIGEGWPYFTARLLDAGSGETLRIFSGHTAPVDSVAFNATGDSILTGSDAVRLWNISDIAARLHCERKQDGLELRWSQGVLQGAPSINGPWNELANATSPWFVETDQGAAFFRVQANPPD